MPSYYAKTSMPETEPLNVLFVIYPDIVLLDLAGPLQVFAGARWEKNGALAYRTAIASLEGGQISTDTVVPIISESLADWVDKDIHTLVVVGGNGANAAMHDGALVSKIETLAQRADRVCSVCSGALILAAAGLLEGRRATTHWQDCTHLARDFPRTRVEPDPIYIKDGSIWTSAGITAGIDMSLAMVAEDLGPKPALELAQSLLTYMVRPGGQSQFSPALQRQSKDQAGKFDALHLWIDANLHKDIRLTDMADQANMSLRSFHRHYLAEIGLTPSKAIESMRIERARVMLETSVVSIKAVAAKCGFGDDERMRRTFIRETGISPSAYRSRFHIGINSKADVC